jgi:hypothetical protein
VKKGTNPTQFLGRTARVALGTGLVAALAVAARFGAPAGAGFAVAVVWAIANFLVLAAILRNATHPGGARRGRLLVLLPLKIFGVYGVGLWILSRNWFPLPALLAGFTWLLVVILLRAAGEMWWERARRTAGSAT